MESSFLISVSYQINFCLSSFSELFRCCYLNKCSQRSIFVCFHSSLSCYYIVRYFRIHFESSSSFLFAAFVRNTVNYGLFYISSFYCRNSYRYSFLVSAEYDVSVCFSDFNCFSTIDKLFDYQVSGSWSSFEFFIECYCYSTVNSTKLT